MCLAPAHTPSTAQSASPHQVWSGPVQQKPWNTLSYCPSVPYPVIKSIRFSPVQFFLLPFAPYLVASLTPLSQRYTLFWAAYSVSKRQSGHTPTLTRSIPLVLTRHTNQFLLLFAIRSSIHTSIHTCSPTSRSLSTTSDNSDREEPGKIICSHHKRGSRRTRNTRSDSIVARIAYLTAPKVIALSRVGRTLSDNSMVSQAPR